MFWLFFTLSILNFYSIVKDNDLVSWIIYSIWCDHCALSILVPASMTEQNLCLSFCVRIHICLPLCMWKMWEEQRKMCMFTKLAQSSYDFLQIWESAGPGGSSFVSVAFWFITVTECMGLRLHVTVWEPWVLRLTTRWYSLRMMQ